MICFLKANSGSLGKTLHVIANFELDNQGKATGLTLN